MPSTFTIRNTSDAKLSVEEKGEQGQGQGQGQAGKALTAELNPGEERTYTVDKNSHVQIREGEQGAQPR